MTGGPLSGLRVLDLTEGIAGPFCTRLLAIYGAEVIKVERPRLGDPVRQRGPFFDGRPGPNSSVPFAYLNTNKRSLCLDLNSEFGQQTVRDMARQVDIVVESFAAGHVEKRGIGPEALRELNPSLVVTSIPMFERGNRYADYRLTELNLYAMSGLTDLVGGRGRPPLKPGSYQAQYMSGLHAAALTLFAAYAARAAGTGAWIETSSVESCNKILCHMRDYTVGESGQAAKPPDIRREAANAVLPCLGGHMTVTLYYFQKAALGELLGNPDLASDPRLADDETMRKNYEALRDEVRNWLSTRTADEAQKEGQSRHLLFTKVNNTRDLTESEHLRARGFFQEVEYPERGVVEHPGPPFRLSETPPPPLTAAPSLGEANKTILCDRLGIPESRLPVLQADGVI